MKNFALLFVLLLFQLVSAQNVFKSQKQIYLAQYYTHLKEDQKALEHYLEAIKINPKVPISDAYLEAASIAFKLKNNKTAKELLTQSITKQLAPLDFLKDFENLQPYKNSAEMKDVISNYDELENQYFRELINPAAYMEIQTLIAKDNLVRENDEIFNMLAKKTDSSNIRQLINLTQKYGWEKRSWVLLWHHRATYKDNDKIWQFFIPYLQTEIANDRLNKDFFVDFEEFTKSLNAHFTKKNDGAIYTLQTLGNLNHNEMYSDVKNLDNRRKTVGLPPLYFDHIIYKIKLPENYKYNPENLLKELENL